MTRRSTANGSSRAPAMHLPLLALLGLAPAALAQAPPQGHSTPSQAPATAAHGTEDISEKLADPIANLISVPFQFNYDANTGPGNDGNRLTMNFQPVIPIPLGSDWLLITRTIVPVIYQDDVVPDGGNTQFGLGDTNQTFFFSPKHSGIENVKFGFGPVFLWPTATNDSLGAERWAVGPAGLALYQKNPWTIGILANHLWSYAGDDDRADVNQSFLQPFLTRQLGQGWSVVAQLEASYDWNQSQWTVLDRREQGDTARQSARELRPAGPLLARGARRRAGVGRAVHHDFCVSRVILPE